MLTDAKCKAAKAADRPYKLADAEQLYLYVSAAGGRSWRMNYTFPDAQGKRVQRTLTLGAYPRMSLVAARAERDRAKDLLRRGLDPAVERKLATKAQAADSANTLELVARRWHALKAPGWSTVHAADVLDQLDADIFAAIGDLPITTIKAPKLLEVLNVVQERGAIERAHRLRSNLSAIFVYAIAAGVAETDPAASLGKALKAKPKAKPQPSIIDRKPNLDAQITAVRQLLIDVEAQRCRAVTKLAMRFHALTAVRPNEVGHARWSEIEDLDGPAPLWRIPAERMKGNKERKAEHGGAHLVPLSTHAVAVLRVLQRLTGDLPLLFPSDRHLHRPISENTLRALLIRAGYYQRHVPHGWRAAFSTIMNDRAKLVGQDGDRAVIDLMLAHVPGNKVEGAYNRAAYLPRRREIAQDWADLLVGDMWPPETHIGEPIRFATVWPNRRSEDAAPG